jgi:ech hydrogenase subunit A
MNEGALLAILLIAIPLAGAVSIVALRRRAVTVAVVATVSVLLTLAAIGLLLLMAASSFKILTIEAHELFPLGPSISLLHFVLNGVFLYIGWRVRSYLVMGFAVINLGLAFSLDAWLNFTPASPAFLIDNLSLIMILITSLVGSIIAIYSLRYMKDDPRQPRFFAVVLLFLGAMNGAVISNEMLWLFMFWEVTTLCSFLLIAHNDTEEAKKAARWALIITIAGGTLFMLGALGAQQYYGTTSMRDLPLSGLGGLALLPLSLFAVAAFTKSAQLPFQSWLLGAMVAPTPVSALLHSATMVNLGVYLLLRTSPFIIGAGAIGWIIALVGGATFLAASLLAITQSNAKRVLAWSTVGNLGLMTMCVGISTPLAIAAAVILLLYHSLSKALMFLSVGVVKEQIGSEDIESMQGIRTTLPFPSLAIFVGIITIVLPPFGMFASKWLISEAVASFPLLMFLLAAGFAGIFVFYFKWMGTILSAGPGARSVRLRDDPSPRNFKWTLGALMVGAVGLSVLIGPVLRSLILPFIDRYYTIPISTNDLTLLTTAGEFPVFIFLLFVAIIFLGLAFLIRPAKEEVSTPYACGENFEFESRSNYYLSESTVKKAISMAEGAGIVLILALLATPLLLEVL